MMQLLLVVRLVLPLPLVQRSLLVVVPRRERLLVVVPRRERLRLDEQQVEQQEEAEKTLLS